MTEQLEVAEALLSRLAITWETMTEILVEAEEPKDPEENPNSSVLQPVSASRSPIGVMLVAATGTRNGRCAGVTEDYGDILAVLAEAGHGLRAGQVAAELGIPTIERSKVERCG